MSKMRVLSFIAVSFVLFAATFAYADTRKSVKTSPPELKHTGFLIFHLNSVGILEVR